MQRRTVIISAASAAVVAAFTGLIVWLSQPSYDDVVKECQQALAAQMKADGEGRPDACQDVKDDDYDALLLNAAFQNLPEKDRKMLDYYDDGSINDSIGDDTP
ncbi:hypothetical protein ACPCAJ_02085 [Streptomyces griseoincarnatus]